MEESVVCALDAALPIHDAHSISLQLANAAAPAPSKTPIKTDDNSSPVQELVCEAVMESEPDANTSTSLAPSGGVVKDVQKRRKGPNICLHGRVWSVCRLCGGGSICQHNRRRSVCKDCGGGGICSHGKQKTQCKACGGACVCPHGKQKSQCKDCGGGSICPHDRVRSKCKECGGGSICRHKKRRSMCVECGGGSVCEHGKRKAMCKLCSDGLTAAADTTASSAPAAATHQSTEFTREDYFRMLMQATASSMPAPASSATAHAPPLPGFPVPNHAQSLSSILAAAAAFSSLDMLKLMEAASAHPPSFGLPCALPFIHPFVSPLLLGANPLLSHPQFASASNFQAFEAFNAALDPSAFSVSHT